MNPADELTPDQWLGQRVQFREGDDHHDCWHFQAGLKSGVVLKKVISLSQKAAMLSAEIDIDPQLFSDDLQVPRLWVKADPSDRFPNGLEFALEPECLIPLGKKPYT